MPITRYICKHCLKAFAVEGVDRQHFPCPDCNGESLNVEQQTFQEYDDSDLRDRGD